MLRWPITYERLEVECSNPQYGENWLILYILGRWFIAYEAVAREFSRGRLLL